MLGEDMGEDMGEDVGEDVGKTQACPNKWEVGEAQLRTQPWARRLGGE